MTQVLEDEEEGHLTWLTGRYQERHPRAGDLSVKPSGMSKCEAGQPEESWLRMASGCTVSGVLSGAMSGDETQR